MGYLIQSSYKTDADIRGKLLLKSIITYAELIPRLIKELPEETKKIPEIIYYLSFMEIFKMHYSSKYLKEIYNNIYKNIKSIDYNTFEKALSLFLLTVIISADGNIDILADNDHIFNEYPELLLMEDFLLRCELLDEIKDKKIKGTIKNHSKKISKRIKNNKYLFKSLLE